MGRIIKTAKSEKRYGSRSWTKLDICKRVLLYHRLAFSVRLILINCIIDMEYQNYEWHFYKTVSGFMTDLGMSRATVLKGLKILKMEGYIEVIENNTNKHLVKYRFYLEQVVDHLSRVKG